MAGRTRRAAPKETAPEPEPAENGELREPGPLHVHMAEWLNDVYGEDLGKPLTPRQVQIVISRRNEYRKSDEYAAFKEEQDELRDQAAAEKAEAKAERARSAAARSEEEEPPAKPARRRRGKAAPAEEEEEEAPAAKPAARRARKAAAASTEDAAPPARRRRRATPASEAEPF
jgi:hypothetical protein